MSLPGRDRPSLDAEIDDLAFAEPDWNGSGHLALRPDHLILGNLRRTNADRAGIEGRRFSGKAGTAGGAIPVPYRAISWAALQPGHSLPYRQTGVRCASQQKLPPMAEMGQSKPPILVAGTAGLASKAALPSAQGD
jgi:hypothetical protein